MRLLISYSRTVYLIFMFSLLNYYFLYKNYNLKFLAKLPFFYFLIGFIAIMAFYIIGDNFNNKDVLNWETYVKNMSSNFEKKINKKNFSDLKLLNFKMRGHSNIKLDLSFEYNKTNSYYNVLNKDSLMMRFINWKEYFKIIIFDIKFFLFGIGLYSGGNIADYEKYCVDNLYLQTIIHIGVIGLTFVLLFLKKLWKLILNYNSNSILIKANISIFPTLYLSAFFVNAIPIYLTYLCFIFFVENKNEQSIR